MSGLVRRRIRAEGAEPGEDPFRHVRVADVVVPGPAEILESR
ncbi:hypothetical protein AB0N16_28145 [Streptomyces sp. NPDC051105]